MREREVKMAAAPTFVLPDLGTLGTDVRVAIAEPERTQTTYVDTEDLRLARAGVSMRLRPGEGWTVKLPGDTDGAVLSRPEFTFPVESTKPPAEAIDLVLAFARTRQIAPVARLRTVRRRILIDDTDGERLLEVDDDEVSVLGEHGRVAARFRELEVEFTERAPTDLVDATVYLLRDAGAADPDPVSKYIHVLGPRARQAPDVTVEPLSREPTAGEVLRVALSVSIRHLIEHDATTRLDDDPEGVHQMRVATRRLRSHLRSFRSLFDETWTTDLRTELAWLGGSLGVVRDADVMLERLRAAIARSPNPDDAAPLEVRLRAQRAESLAILLADLRSDRYLRLLDALVEAARLPPLTEAAQGPPASLLVPLQVDREALAKRVRRLGKRPAEEDLHRVRVHAKRFRYAAEAIEPVYGKTARTGAKAAAELQGVLGERHDAIVFRTWLHDAAVEGHDPVTAFAAGEFAGEELVGLVRSRRAWRPAWRRLAASREPTRWSR